MAQSVTARDEAVQGVSSIEMTVEQMQDSVRDMDDAFALSMSEFRLQLDTIKSQLKRLFNDIVDIEEVRNVE